MSIKKNSKVIVTGAAGFIGSHLCTALVDQGYDVHAIDNLSTGRKENLNHIKNKIKFENRHHKSCYIFD